MNKGNLRIRMGNFMNHQDNFSLHSGEVKNRIDKESMAIPMTVFSKIIIRINLYCNSNKKIITPIIKILLAILK